VRTNGASDSVNMSVIDEASYHGFFSHLRFVLTLRQAYDEKDLRNSVARMKARDKSEEK